MSRCAPSVSYTHLVRGAGVEGLAGLRLALHHVRAAERALAHDRGLGRDARTDVGGVLMPKTLKAVVIVIPISAQNASNCRFKSASIRLSLIHI